MSIKKSWLYRVASSSENGFTLVEVATVVIILGIVLAVASVSYANISRGMSLKGATSQVESAINRAKTSARQENVDYRIVFYPSTDASYPNTYEFYHSVYDGEWTLQPVDKSVSGESVTEADGHFYIEVGNNVQISGEQKSVDFIPEGTTMTITSATISLEKGGHTSTVSIDSMGVVEVD